MAFDRTDPADLAALKTEVTTDPISMGYNTNANVSVLMKQLNSASLNVGGETTAREFDALALLDALDPTDYDAQQTATDAAVYVHTLVEVSVQHSIEAYKTKFRNLFAANSATVQALDAQTRPLSRAEVLFGDGTVLSQEDWFAARDS